MAILMFCLVPIEEIEVQILLLDFGTQNLILEEFEAMITNIKI
jgi:hypothetical protein